MSPWNILDNAKGKCWKYLFQTFWRCFRIFNTLLCLKWPSSNLNNFLLGSRRLNWWSPRFWFFFLAYHLWLCVMKTTSKVKTAHFIDVTISTTLMNSIKWSTATDNKFHSCSRNLKYYRNYMWAVFICKCNNWHNLGCHTKCVHAESSLNNQV